MQRGRVLLTSDWRLLEENPGRIPDFHPGIVMVSSERSHLTHKQIQEILDAAKVTMAGWEHSELRNSIVYVTFEYLRLGHLVNGEFVLDYSLNTRETGQPAQMLAHLTANAARA